MFRQQYFGVKILRDVPVASGGVVALCAVSCVFEGRLCGHTSCQVMYTRVGVGVSSAAAWCMKLQRDRLHLEAYMFCVRACPSVEANRRR